MRVPTAPLVVASNVVVPPKVVGLGAAVNEAITNEVVAGDTVRTKELVAVCGLGALSWRLTVTVNAPTPVGVQEKLERFALAHPPGSPVYA